VGIQSPGGALNQAGREEPDIKSRESGAGIQDPVSGRGTGEPGVRSHEPLNSFGKKGVFASDGARGYGPPKRGRALKCCFQLSENAREIEGGIGAPS